MSFDRKILAVAKEQFLGIAFHHVNFGANFLGFAWREAAHVRIAMQAHEDALKQFMRAAGSRRQQFFAVRRETPNQAVNWLVLTNGPWVHVCQADPLWDIHLAASI